MPGVQRRQPGLMRVRLCNVAELQGDRLLTELPGSGDPVLVLRDGHGVHVVEALCPHQYAPLLGGELIDGVLTCPMHNWRFNVHTGRSPDMPACLQRWDAIVVGDEIWLTGDD